MILLLLPPCQQSLGAAAPATSCRSGAVVHLVHRLGACVPVTLQMSTYDDGDRVQHIVRALPSSERERLDRQRLVLTLGEAGAVEAVNPGASKAVFGFDPQV
jgi:hypothetical protein